MSLTIRLPPDCWNLRLTVEAYLALELMCCGVCSVSWACYRVRFIRAVNLELVFRSRRFELLLFEWLSGGAYFCW